MVHLDTNIVIAHLRGHDKVTDRIEAALPDLALSTIVLAELTFGVYVVTKHHAEHQARLAEFVKLVNLIDFDRSCADAYGRIRAKRRRLGRSIGEADALIAATALTHRAILATHNLRTLRILTD